MSELIQTLSQSADESLQLGIDEIIENAPRALREWWNGEELRRRFSVISVEQDVQKSVREAVAKLRAFQKVLNDNSSELDDQLRNLEQELRERFAGDNSLQRIADLRTNAEKRLRRVQALRTTYLQKWKSLTDAMSEREAILDQLVRTQNEIAGIRSKLSTSIQERLNSFLPSDMRVSIEFRAGGDTEELGKWLHRVFGARGNQPKKIRRVIESRCNPAALSKMIRAGDFSPLLSKGSPSTEPDPFSREDAECCSEQTRLFEHDEYADVPILTARGKALHALLDLEEVVWDDWEAILLNGRPVNEKSPGQRSSAMLPLIALSETTPLIIDQPEDNLDKRLIGNVLVRVLAELKEQRQIIVCTHDPNILVGGDAEQVIVLEAESDRRGYVRLHGSIDNKDIVETVIDLLEGGAEAFKARQKRYRGKVGLVS